MRLLVSTGTLCVALLLPPLLGAQSTALVAGVADARTGKPLADAELVLFDLHRVVHTDWLGEARIANVPSGKHRVRVRKLGYAASDVELLFQGDTIGPVFMLEPNPRRLDTVRVTAERVPSALEPFEIRRHMGIGRFLTDSQLVKEWDRPFAFVAMTHFPGLATMTDVDGRQYLVSTRGSCGGVAIEHGAMPPRLSAGGVRMAAGAGSGGGGGAGGGAMLGSCNQAACPVKVYLDDMDLTQEDFDIVRTWDLDGVEYYTGAEVPVRYRVSGTACGVLLLWSKW